jgi:signal transduction histidine kinase
VRWRLAGVSASLTFVILVCFAFVVGQLAADSLRDDFRDEVEKGANELASAAAGSAVIRNPELERAVMAEESEIRVVYSSGAVYKATPEAPDFGPPQPGVHSVGSYEVASSQIPQTDLGPPRFVQYGRSKASLDRSIDRLWLFLAGGILGGTILATLAGLAVASRAMRPISSLTVAAREIAATRDPSVRLPRPVTEDEVGELASTLDVMLRQLDAARSETEAMIQAQREFVADASHELRTPLTSILANLELLEERLAREGADEDESEMVASALASSRRMRRLVSDLLLLARADAGRSGPRIDCDLSQIASAAVAEVRPVAGDHEIAFAADGPVPVEGNPDDLHRLVLNLVENAVRHTPPGSTVELTVRTAGDEAQLDVSDNGPGLPDGLGDSIFFRFVRGDGPADTAADSGTGLGLAIVRAVASSHGGGVESGRSQAGGARFVVHLPLAERRAATASTELANT